MFDVERDLLAAIIPEARAIEHIGSTSIPGLAAKPTIDILAVVDEISGVLDRRSVLAELGYEYRPDPSPTTTSTCSSARCQADERGRYIAEKVDVVSELLSEAFRWRSRS